LSNPYNSQRGLLYYDTTDNTVYVCKGAAGWQQLAGWWAAWGNNIYNTNTGNVGIGVLPTQRLDISGRIRIRYGYPGAGKVLTSDANGVASWQSPAANFANNIKFDIIRINNSRLVTGGRNYSWHTYDVTTGFRRLFSAIAIPQWSSMATKDQELQQAGMIVKEIKINNPINGKFKIIYGIKARWDEGDRYLDAWFIWIAIGEY